MLAASIHVLSLRADATGEYMNKMLMTLGKMSGLAGVLLCVAAGAWRLTGNFEIAGIWVGTLLQVGMAGLLTGCFCLLIAQAEPR